MTEHNLRLPAEGKRGDWSITREERRWGDTPSLYTFLREGGHCWMSDVPLEMQWTHHLAIPARGDDILIGGLGLGLLPQLLLPARGRSVTVLEKHQEVIDLVLAGWDDMPVGLMVERYDVWEFLRQPPTRRYDTIIMDIWTEVDSPAMQAEIAHLRQLAEPWLAPGGRWIAWGESWIDF